MYLNNSIFGLMVGQQKSPAQGVVSYRLRGWALLCLSMQMCMSFDSLCQGYDCMGALLLQVFYFFLHALRDGSEYLFATKVQLETSL